jgi:hypothetical protein
VKTKNELEEELRPERRGRPRDGAVDAPVEVAGQRAVVGPGDHPQPRQADEPVTVAEHQAPAEDQERQRRGREDDEVLEEDVDGVLGTAQPGLDHRESEVHEEHQERGHHHPDRVEGDLGVVDRGGRRRLLRRGGAAEAEKQEDEKRGQGGNAPEHVRSLDHECRRSL